MNLVYKHETYDIYLNIINPAYEKNITDFFKPNPYNINLCEIAKFTYNAKNICKKYTKNEQDIFIFEFNKKQIKIVTPKNYFPKATHAFIPASQYNYIFTCETLCGKKLNIPIYQGKFIITDKIIYRLNKVNYECQVSDIINIYI